MTEPTPTTTIEITTCQEDEPCWDCHTMGNLICGPTQATVGVSTPPSHDLPATGIGAGGMLAVAACLVAVGSIFKRKATT